MKEQILKDLQRVINAIEHEDIKKNHIIRELKMIKHDIHDLLVSATDD